MVDITSPATDERLLAALEELDRMISDNVARSREIQRRVRHIERRIRSGRSLAETVQAESEPRTMEMITTNIDVLQGIGAQLRTAQAQALREEGLTISAIADLFGVTRQRVSALLRQKSATTPIGE